MYPLRLGGPRVKWRTWLRVLAVLLWRWLPVALWMAWIYWLSDQPNLPHPARRLGLSDYLFDYSAHAFTFGLLAALVWRALVLRRLAQPGGIIMSSGTLAALYAVTDELHQGAVPGRTSSLRDWLADVAGVALAMVALWLWGRLRPRLARR
ncbi:MAG: VanZ family protein [Chloroflexota bacterium]